MVSVLNQVNMEANIIEKAASEDGEILEDGELDDEEVEEEVIPEENAKVEDVVQEVVEEQEDVSNDEKKKKKKHRHRKHEKSDERKKRKRKKHGQEMDDNEGSPGKKRKKRKKHTRNSSTPESESSEYSRRSTSMQRYDTSVHATDNYDYYYGAQDQYGDYEQSENMQDAANTKVIKQNYLDQDELYEEGLEDDFESQLADYQKYKVSGKTKPKQQGDNEDQYYPTQKRKHDRNKNRTRNQQNFNNRNEHKNVSHKRSNNQRISRWNSTDTGASYNNQNQPNRHKLQAPEYNYDNNNQDNGFYGNEDSYTQGTDYSSQYDEEEKKSTHKRELCKYYLAGHCHHGDKCSYMHGEYPCKYFHTGAQCYMGDGCRFSHDPPTEKTQEIVEKLQEFLSDVDDSWELEELQKQGITPNPKPPPGQGLLPTPQPDMPAQFHAMMAAAIATGQMPNFPPPNFMGMPSVFDLNVQPTPDFQDRIDKNEVPSIKMIEEYEAHYYAKHPNEKPPPKVLKTTNSNKETNVINSCSRTPPWLRPTEQSQEETSAIEEDNHETEEEAKAPDFLPAKQKELFMRINQKSKQDETKENTSPNKMQPKDANDWSYSSDEEGTELKIQTDSDVIKMDAEETTTPTTTQSSVQSIMNMIASKQEGAVDKNLLTKVANAINMANSTKTPSGTVEMYTPSMPSMTLPSYTVKESPKHNSHRERKSSNSSTGSTSSTSRPHHHHPLRKRISTQDLHKDPVSIPLVAKENINNLHSSHPDPRMSLSRLFGKKKGYFAAEIPPFCKEFLLASGKLVGLKITLSSESKSSSTKRVDPRLSRRTDPRTAKANDPRLRRKHAEEKEEVKTAKPTIIPPTPPALITKTSTPIPSLPELNLDMANVKNSDSESDKKDLPKLPQLPKLTKAPLDVKNEESPPVKTILAPSPPENIENNIPPSATIAPYDPRYMTSNASSKPTLKPAPYDPRTQTAVSYDTSEKRTIQLPKLTIAPTFKSRESNDIPAGDQGDF